MRAKKRFRKARTFVYFLVIAGIAWQALALTRTMFPTFLSSDHSSIKVVVEGNVRRPGYYRVPYGTTEFELLKAAGVRSSSDISPFTLVNQVIDNDALDVGELESPAGLRDIPNVRLEFFLGEMTLLSGDGRILPAVEGAMLSEGDRIQTEAASQAEVSLSRGSRVDLDNFSEIIIDKIDVDDRGRPSLELFQRSGLCWYKIEVGEKREVYRINTPQASITVGGSGAEFFIQLRAGQVIVSNLDGLVYLERHDGSEAVNIISGQTAIVHQDGRPFQITSLTDENDMSARFSPLEEQRRLYLTRNLPLNFLFCGLPYTFYVISLHFETATVNVIRIPPELLIEQFVHGFATIDQAFLYGGPVIVSSLLERVINLRIANYFVMDRYDIIRTANALGGVTVPVDPAAASALNVPGGQNKLSDAQLIEFLSSGISGIADSKKRQIEVLRHLFEGLREQNIVMSALLADQLISNIETNLTSNDIMSQYSRFTGRQGWVFRQHELPVTPVKRGNRTCYEPQLQLSRNLF
ncbi:hypothetical protein CHISP_0998 [Chitinispirillum alkaliphilum]|nr:hypothetical protein CHISP_0998 [Chitinispirillum alkaliphilum]